ncbi:tail length tape measure protein [Streptomyces phage Attoomi]|uniref:Tape measure protein n=1 Tax=Streptomyces phage Attoomi TaxID=2059881 RepID=A0A2H5BLG0_9CAUD|nr:tail length tape measure protein [Streptomyces phage Attoomi]AUG87147.1 tape measure protein [Streptomyces phage Attoomi]
MAGPGGREAGRLSIKVLPDTSNFAGSLQRYLDRIERRARVQVQAVPDLADFRQRLNTQLSRVRARVRVNVDPDLSAFRATLRARLEGADASLGVRLEVDEGEIARLRQELAHITPPITIPAHVDVDRNSLAAMGRSLGNMGRDGNGAARGLASVAGAAARLTTMASAIPAVAGLAAGLAAMAPAAGVAAPALLMVASAQAAIKIGTAGVSDALKGNAEALAKLSPAARDFVTQAKALAPAWSKVKSTVQENLFQGLGDSMTRTANSVLPILRTQLGATATTLNGMAKGVAETAKSLADNGTLGTALKGANTGLKNLSGLPKVLVQGLGQVGAASGSAFAKLTKGAGGALDRLSARMTKAFESGAMQASIERAIGLVRQLFTTLGDIGETVGNIFGPAAEAGGGFLTVLSDVAAMAAKVTASPEAQETFRALFETLAAIGHAVGGVLGAALKAAMPLLNTLATTLSGPIQSAVQVLAPAFQQLATLLGTALAPVVKIVSQALAMILPIAANLIAQLAGALGPILVTVGQLLGQIGAALLTAIRPILAQLPGILAPILGVVQKLLPIFAQIAAQLISALAPALAQIGAAFGRLLVAAGPLITALGQFLAKALQGLMPVITSVIGIVGKIAGVLASLASKYINGIAIPAIKMITRLFQGDFKGALNFARQLLSNLGSFFGSIFSKIRSVVSSGVSAVVGFFRNLGSQAWSAVKSMGSNVASSAASAMKSLGSKISSGVSTAVGYVKGLPGKAKAALGSLGSTLLGAGKSLIQGFINGIKGMIGSVKSTLGDLTSKLTSWKGPPAKDKRILTPAGRLLIQGFIKGIDGTTAQLRSKLQSITKLLPKYTKSGVVKSLKASTAQLNALVSKRDAVTKRLEAAEKRLADVRKKYDETRTSIRDGILSGANITQGGESGAAVTVQSITDKLKADMLAAKKFAADLAKLKAKGLSDSLLEQIASAGVDGGGAYAAALADASNAQISELNRTQKQLEAYAGKAGTVTADALYGSGVHAAEGLVKGLKSQEKAIENQMLKIAKSMEKAIKKALGIKSPSRVMAKVGKWIPAGLVRGIEGGKPKVDRLMDRLVTVPSVATVKAGALVPNGVMAGGSEHVPTTSAGVVIENYHAGGLTAGQVARELEWRMKARG